MTAVNIASVGLHVWHFRPEMCQLVCLNAYILDVNECASNPCQNAGSCVDGLLSYSCMCAQGLEGDDCERGERPPMLVNFLTK